MPRNISSRRVTSAGGSDPAARIGADEHETGWYRWVALEE